MHFYIAIKHLQFGFSIKIDILLLFSNLNSMHNWEFPLFKWIAFINKKEKLEMYLIAH